MIIIIINSYVCCLFFVWCYRRLASSLLPSNCLYSPSRDYLLPLCPHHLVSMEMRRTVTGIIPTPTTITPNQSRTPGQTSSPPTPPSGPSPQGMPWTRPALPGHRSCPPTARRSVGAPDQAQGGQRFVSLRRRQYEMSSSFSCVTMLPS